MTTDLYKPVAALPDAFALRIRNLKDFTSKKARVAPWRSLTRAKLTQLSVSVHALPEGLVVFDFSRNPDYQGGAVSEASLRKNLYFSGQAKRRMEIVQRRALVMNAFLACFYEGSQPHGFGAEAQPSINPENYMTAVSNRGKWHVEGPAIYPGMNTCPAEALTTTAQIFNKINKAYGADATNLLSLLQVAGFQYRSQNFPAALTTGWFVVEALQNILWQSYLKAAEKHTAFSQSRMDQLNGRDFTASVISQILSLGRKIDDVILNKLNTARKKRNDFAHELLAVEAQDASNALGLAADLISKRIGQQFRLGLSYSWRP